MYRISATVNVSYIGSYIGHCRRLVYRPLSMYRISATVDVSYIGHCQCLVYRPLSTSRISATVDVSCIDHCLTRYAMIFWWRGPWIRTSRPNLVPNSWKLIIILYRIIIDTIILMYVQTIVIIIPKCHSCKHIRSCFCSILPPPPSSASMNARPHTHTSTHWRHWYISNI